MSKPKRDLSSNARKDVGRMKILKAIGYKGNMIYVRMVGKDIFIWDAIFKNQLYSSYILMKPRKGKKALSDEEIMQVTELAYAGACTTIDTLLGVKLSKAEQEKVRLFEAAQSNFKTLN